MNTFKEIIEILSKNGFSAGLFETKKFTRVYFNSLPEGAGKINTKYKTYLHFDTKNGDFPDISGDFGVLTNGRLTADARKTDGDLSGAFENKFLTINALVNYGLAGQTEKIDEKDFLKMSL